MRKRAVSGSLVGVTDYVLLLNGEAVEELEAETQTEAMHAAVDLSAKHRGKARGLTDVRWALGRKGSDDGPDEFMWWGHWGDRRT
jgi:hypothetical protein